MPLLLPLLLHTLIASRDVPILLLRLLPLLLYTIIDGTRIPSPPYESSTEPTHLSTVSFPPPSLASLPYWQVINKVPGLKFEVQQMRMDLLYSSKFDDNAKPMPEAYERLLLEAPPPPFPQLEPSCPPTRFVTLCQSYFPMSTLLPIVSALPSECVNPAFLVFQAPLLMCHPSLPTV